MELANLTKLNKKELIDLVNDKYINTRIWLSERGEKALFLGVGVGIFLAIFYKLAIGALVLLAVAGALLWHLAPDDASDLAHARGVEAEFGKKATQSEDVAEGSDMDALKEDRKDEVEVAEDKAEATKDTEEEPSEDDSESSAKSSASSDESSDLSVSTEQEAQEDEDQVGEQEEATEEVSEEINEEQNSEAEEAEEEKKETGKKDSKKSSESESKKADSKNDAKNGKGSKDTETLEIKLD